jgi:hypothetical protein
METLASPSKTFDDASSSLTSTKIAILVAFSTVVWFLAAMFIRFIGPTGIFQGVQVVVLYLVTIPATMPLNARSRKLARLPKRQMVSVIAVTSATATMLDGVAMSQFPQLYGSDPAIIAGGAAWLLWAIGVAGVLSLVTSAQATPAR